MKYLFKCINGTFLHKFSNAKSIKHNDAGVTTTNLHLVDTTWWRKVAGKATSSLRKSNRDSSLLLSNQMKKSFLFQRLKKKIGGKKNFAIFTFGEKPHLFIILATSPLQDLR